MATKNPMAGTPAEGRVTFELRSDGIGVCRYAGHVTERVMSDSKRYVEDAITRPDLKGLVFDTVAVTSFDASVRGPGTSMFSSIKRAGMKNVFAAASSTAVRMMGSAWAFATGTPMVFVDSPDEALRRAHENMPKR